MSESLTHSNQRRRSNRLTLSSLTIHSTSLGSPFSSPHSAAPGSSPAAPALPPEPVLAAAAAAAAAGPLALSRAISLTTLAHARGCGSPLKPTFHTLLPRSRTTRSSVPYSEWRERSEVV